eukprot:scaffold1111_cov176-Skeletonema_marinoi.AAC.6
MTSILRVSVLTILVFITSCAGKNDIYIKAAQRMAKTEEVEEVPLPMINDTEVPLPMINDTD